MKRNRPCLLLFAILALAATSRLALAADGAPAKNARKKAPVVILKLDDINTKGGHGPQAPVSPRWQRVTDFIVKNKLKAAFGIIGSSLEQDNPAYFQWIKELDKSGTIEFWNHGYKERTAADKIGEFEGSYEDQKRSLEQTQRLAKEKLGIELKAFGAHWSGANAATAQALAEIPEIKMIFYFPEVPGKLVFPRILTIENPTFVPDFEKFKAIYESRAKNAPVLAMQGHPNQWDEKRWAGFVKIVEFLKAQGCVFMTPSQYLAQSAGAAAQK
jgi:peptidoglycan/xylan/chitin deacetylase (PgdA/CDA1 family)